MAAQSNQQQEETLSLENIMDYMTNKHPKIYQYLLNKTEEEEFVEEYLFKDLLHNSLILFLAIRRKLGWEIWPEDLNGPFYNMSFTLLEDNPILSEVHSFTIRELRELLRNSAVFLAYAAFERIPYIFEESENVSKTEVKKDRLAFLKALLKYRYETNEDFELVHHGPPPPAQEPEPIVAPKYISGNILEGMSQKEIYAWAKGQIGRAEEEEE